ncbi:MAG: alanine--tRNA ligase [Tissierellia bacterium]|nr:alanine--tRNA ligase [Tissierellia bacterium]
MKELKFNEIRKAFLDFFESKSHTRLKSYSLIPEKDKSLLLINAGMAPLKEYFTGVKKMPNDRATSSQRCVRTLDIDNVGKTHRHATFFEMLGNFSFGNYFKEEAITWAWEFLTEELELDPEKLYITVYEEDQDAYDIWHDKIGLAADRIKKQGKEENFWELEEGPCGPCSEIHYDRGESFSENEEDRFMEIWNLVFTQFDKDSEGNYNPLPAPNIDTGMGLERLALVLEGASNIFELDSFSSLMKEIEKLSGKEYGKDSKDDESFRVIMDHSKAMSFLIYDGVIPSNEGRGYILRRLIRRAYRHGKLLGISSNFLSEMVKVVSEIYQPEYPELKEDYDRIVRIVKQEEDKFQETIDQGLSILNDLIRELKESGRDEIEGKDAFKLYDTYGFPIDLTIEIAADNSMQVDQEGFKQQMQIQKENSRKSKGFEGGWEEDQVNIEGYGKTDFVGYDNFELKSKIKAIILDSKEVSTIEKGHKAIIILDKTPFYGEGGGQVGDTGIIETNNAKLKVLDTKKNAEETYYNYVEVVEGSLNIEDQVLAKIDVDRRLAITKNHSATHILHKALRMVLGNHIKQAGSHVDENRTRFDFTHFEAISDEDLRKVEEIANRQVFLGLDVAIKLTDLKSSQEMGAIGLFEDKYKDVVRVVSMGDFSTELCGGCHVRNTSQVQMIKITSESGIAAGVRRIEAITGNNVYQYINKLEKRENSYSQALKSSNDNILNRILDLQEVNSKLEKEIKDLNSLKEGQEADQLIKQIKAYDGYNLLISKFDAMPMDEMRNISDKIKDKREDMVIVFASILEGKLLFLSSVSKNLTKKGFNAGKIVKFVAQKTGGNGGGRPDFASAGGKDISALDSALEEVIGFIANK